jgi:hypothetical protein
MRMPLARYVWQHRDQAQLAGCIHVENKRDVLSIRHTFDQVDEQVLRIFHSFDRWFDRVRRPNRGVVPAGCRSH